MVIIRLRRGGKTHEPHYRIVAQEKRSKLKGKYIESLGHYHPLTKDKQLVVDKDKILEWIKNGATLSDTVNNLLVKEGILAKEQKISKVFSKKKNKKGKESTAPLSTPPESGKPEVKESKEESTEPVAPVEEEKKKEKTDDEIKKEEESAEVTVETPEETKKEEAAPESEKTENTEVKESDEKSAEETDTNTESETSEKE